MTSVGFVTRPEFVQDKINVPPDRLLQWAIARCPAVRHRMRNAAGPAENRVLSDFSYTCSPYAGPGYFLVGDAACFLDPIFSTGVTLAMMSGREAARHAIDILARKPAARTRATGVPAIRQGEHRRLLAADPQLLPPLVPRTVHEWPRAAGSVHNAVISILAGEVFPGPPWALRWRLWFFVLCVQVQRRFALVPRRREFCS